MAPTGQRVLFVGATGHIGSFIAKEAAAKGHHVTALVSERSLGDPGKKAVLEELKAAGVQLTKGTLDAPQSTLVELAKKADVVRSFSAEMGVCASEAPAQGALADPWLQAQIICAVNEPVVALQTNLVQAAATAGNVKQFFPSEFGIFGAVGAARAAWPLPGISVGCCALRDNHLLHQCRRASRPLVHVTYGGGQAEIFRVITVG